MKRPNVDELLNLYQDPDLAYLALGSKSYPYKDFLSQESLDEPFFCENTETRNRVQAENRADLIKEAEEKFLSQGVSEGSLVVRQKMPFNCMITPSADRNPDGTANTEKPFIGIYLNEKVDYTFPKSVEFKGYLIEVKVSLPSSFSEKKS